MRGTAAVQTLVQQKLAAFDRLQPEFEASFRFVQEVHGQWRFAAFLWLKRCTISMLSGSVSAKIAS